MGPFSPSGAFGARRLRPVGANAEAEPAARARSDRRSIVEGGWNGSARREKGATDFSPEKQLPPAIVLGGELWYRRKLPPVPKKFRLRLLMTFGVRHFLPKVAAALSTSEDQSKPSPLRKPSPRARPPAVRLLRGKVALQTGPDDTFLVDLAPFPAAQ